MNIPCRHLLILWIIELNVHFATGYVTKKNISFISNIAITSNEEISL